MESRLRRLPRRYSLVTAGRGRDGNSVEVGSHLRFPTVVVVLGDLVFTSVLVPGPWRLPSFVGPKLRPGLDQHRFVLDGDVVCFSLTRSLTSLTSAVWKQKMGARGT